MAINALQKLCRGDTAIAKQIIEQSMANLYKGLFPLKQQQSNNNQISTQNGTLQERKYAHIHKAIRNLERLGSLSAEQVEVAQRYLAVATGQINSTEFISKLVKYDSRNSKSDFGDIGDSLRLGE
jgi:hypothetical protein